MKYFKFFIIFVLTTQMAFANLCQFVFAPGVRGYVSQDIKLIGKLNRIEKFTNIARKIRSQGGEEHILMMKQMQEEFKGIEGQFFKGEVNLAIRKWRGLFRKVERSALEAENYTKIIKVINKGELLNIHDYKKFFRDEGIPEYLISQHYNELYKVGANKYIGRLYKKLRKSYRKLGNNYEKYKFIKTRLDDLGENSICTPLCKQSLNNLNHEIGITSQAERHLHQNIIQNRKIIHLKTVRKIFNSHPEAVVIARRKEFISEAVGLLKKLYNNTRLMRKLYRTLGHSAAGKNLKLSRMFKRIFDKRFHTINKGIIDKVSYSNLKGKGKMDLLKAETKEIDFNAILVDFSRKSDQASKEAWQEMKNYASKSSKNSVLYKEMLEAQELGKKIGKTSKRLPKDIGTLISTLVVGGAFVSYFSFGVKEDDFNSAYSNATILPADTPDRGVVILDNNDIDDIESDDDIIILKYNSKLDRNLREELIEVVDSLNQNTANLSSLK